MKPSAIGRLIGTAMLLATVALAQERPFVIGFAQDNLANDWRAAQVEAVRKGLIPHPEVRFVQRDARGSTAQQILDIETLVGGGVDLLITSPRDGVALTPVVTRAHAAGTPVVLLTRRIEGDGFSAFVGPDDRAIARRAADFIAERLGGKGHVLMLQGVPTASTAVARTVGFLEQLDHHPGVKVTAIKVGNYLRSDAIRALEEALAEGIDFDAIYAQSDSMASGARLALRAAGHDPRAYVIVGIDYIPEAREAIRAGEQSASFTYPTCGREGAEIALRILRGEPYPRETTVPSVLVTQENVERVAPIF